MRIGFIGNQTVPLPRRAVAGQALTPVEAAILTEIHHARIASQLRYMLAKGTITKRQLQQKAIELAKLPLTAGADEDASDPVLLEAIALAKEMLTAEAVREGLPTKTIEARAKAVVDANPALRAKAQERLAAKYTMMQSILEEAI